MNNVICCNSVTGAHEEIEDEIDQWIREIDGLFIIFKIF